MKIHGFVGVVLLITASVFTGVSFLNSETDAQHIEHGLILIEGDADFIDQAINESWPGDGTEGNPYLITNYQINITDVQYMDRYHGISIKNTTVYFEISDSIIERGYNSYSGIYLENVENVVIRNCTLSKNKHGIYINISNHIEINANIFHNNRDNGISMEYSSNNIITNNKASENIDDTIYLLNSTHNDISHNKISAWDNGIYLVNSNQNDISHNEVYTRKHCIYLEDSNNNLVEYNIIDGYKLDLGIILESSTGNSIEHNTIHNLYRGIYLKYSNGTTVISNTLTDNNRAISLTYSLNNSIQANTMIENSITLDGNEKEHWNTHEIGTSNTVNGKPVQYWKDQTSGTVPEGAGQVILANCQNVTVSNQTLSLGTIGIEMGFSVNCNINNNTISQNKDAGIYIEFSNGTSIDQNNFKDNKNDIEIRESFGNSVTSNDFSKGIYGIYHFRSEDTEIRGNQISNCSLGIFIDFLSKNCNITENKLINSSIYLWELDVTYATTHNIDTSNTVNGDPIYFWKNKNGGSVPSNAGEVIIVNCTDVIIENQEISNTTFGIKVICSSNITLINNSLTDSGVVISNSSHLKIENNKFKSDNGGIYLEKSWENNINHNNFTNNDISIQLYDSNENQITMNNFLENNGGIRLIDSSNNSIHENIFQNNTGISISVRSSALSSSSFNIISYNDVVNNQGSGIWFSDSFDVNIIIHNNISFNGKRGIALGRAENISITHNIISSNGEYGIHTFDSKNIEISDNTISHNEDAITLEMSEEIFIANNTILNDGLMISGYYRKSWNSHQIQESNTVNGKPLYYWNNKIGGIVPSDAGQIILANCTDVTVENQKITNTSIGIEIGYSTNCNVSYNILNDNTYGIFHSRSLESNISKNSVSNNNYGIYLERTSHWKSQTKIMGNVVSENIYGLYLDGSDNNNIIANNITGNENGIFMDDSSDNVLHHNNIIDNAVQLNLFIEINTWDNEGGVGNYWSDYNGNDTNEDGIGDTDVPHHGVDNFPMMWPANISKEYLVSVDDAEPQERIEGEPYRPSPLALGLIMVVLIILIIILSKPAKKKKQKDAPPLGWDMHGLGLETTPATEESELLDENHQDVNKSE
jgi:parallel beta-helix repeat protein